MPARAGSGAASPASTTRTASSPQHRFATRTGIVYPLELPQVTASDVASLAQHSRGSRRLKRLRASATSLDETLPELPSLATLALTATPNVSTSFAGIAFPQSDCGAGCEPPSGQVAAGPNDIFEVSNVAGEIFDKSDNVLKSAFSLNTFFDIGSDLFSSDPRIEYDTLAQRWYVSLLSLDNTDITNSQNGFWNLAVSINSNPLDGFNLYSVETPGDFPDQPPLGFNDDKIVTGGNSFSCDPDCEDGDYEGNEFLVWNKSELLAAPLSPTVNAEAIDTDFYPPGPAGAFQDSSDFPIIPAKSRSSTTTLFMVDACVTNFSNCANTLNIWAINGVPGVESGTNADITQATIETINAPPPAIQKGTAKIANPDPIDTGDARILDAVYRDGIVWASGGAACSPSASDPKTRSCLEYYEVLTEQETTDTPVLNQNFVFGTNFAYDYYPSVDMDSSDDVITAFSQSSSTEFPSAYVAGRLAADPAGLGTPVLIQAGATTYISPNPEPTTKALPWGDYSGAGVDPTDQTAVWVAAEYAGPTSEPTPNWSTWIAEARVLTKATPTATPTATSTPSASATSTVTSTPTKTATPTVTATSTATASVSPTATTTTSATPATATATPTIAASPTVTVTATSTATATATVTATPTPTPTATSSPGTLSVSGSLSFGKVKVGSSKSQNLKVENKGKFPLQVMVGSLEPPFTVTAGGGSFTLAKNKSETVKVEFQPTVVGATTPQMLMIMSDDPKHRQKDVTATGSGK